MPRPSHSRQWRPHPPRLLPHPFRVLWHSRVGQSQYLSLSLLQLLKHHRLLAFSLAQELKRTVVSDNATFQSVNGLLLLQEQVFTLLLNVFHPRASKICFRPLQLALYLENLQCCFASAQVLH